MNIPRGSLLIFIGLALFGAGVLHMVSLFDWFRRLPGDIRSEGENTRVFIPVTSMVIVPVAVSILFQIVRRFFG